MFSITQRTQNLKIQNSTDLFSIPGHQVVLCPHVIINSSTCRGFLHKKGSKLNGWSKRWFVFDRNKHTFTYYSDKSEKKTRGGAYFQVWNNFSTLFYLFVFNTLNIAPVLPKLKVNLSTSGDVKPLAIFRFLSN